MSETAPDEAITTAAEHATEPAAESGETSAAEPRPDREAAKYRRQLRETEAKATALSGRLEAMQRREVERLAAVDLATPADLWLTGPELPELLDDEGDVDPEKVAAAVAEVVETRPGWKRPAPPPSFDGGARTTPASRGRTMQDLLRGGTAS